MHQFEQVVMRFGLGEDTVQRVVKADACWLRVEELRHQAVLKPGFLARPGQVADKVVSGFAKGEFRDAGILFANSGLGDCAVESLDGVGDMLRQGRRLSFDRYEPQLSEEHQQRGRGGKDRICRCILHAGGGVEQNVLLQREYRGRGCSWRGFLNDHGSGRPAERHLPADAGVEDRRFSGGCRSTLHALRTGAIGSAKRLFSWP